ncbi:hypothetical protein P2Q00_28760 [Streptomyces coacervatus]|nr:hypothetical protein [Streptomyces coacervatus]MDF2269402.1 hypothetical protein [Streptomyces coacervatus]
MPKVHKAAEQGVDGLKKLWRQVESDENLSRNEVLVVRAAIERTAAEVKNPKKFSDPTSDDVARLRAAAAEQQDQAAEDPGDFEELPPDEFTAA